MAWSIFWRSPEATWRATGTGAAGIGPLKRLMQDYVEAVTAANEQLERAKTAEEYFKLLQLLAPLARSTRNLHRALQDARDAAGDDKELITLRDRAYEVERDTELLHGDASGQHAARTAIFRGEGQSEEAQLFQERCRHHQLTRRAGMDRIPLHRHRPDGRFLLGGQKRPPSPVAKH